MINLETALQAHEEAIEAAGGSSGLRDREALEGALARPFGGFGAHEFYPLPEEKAAAILESILINHPFVDGNKRTGFLLMAHILGFYGAKIEVAEDEQYDFVISVASGNLSFEEIVAWIKAAVQPR